MYKKRIEKLQKELNDHEIDSLLITSSYNIAYLTGIYAFSNEEREARVLITQNQFYLFTDARYTGMVTEKMSFITLKEISAKNSFTELVKRVIKKLQLQSVGFEEENISYREVSALEEKIHDVELIPTSDIVERIRMVKDNLEIEQIKKACLLTDKAFNHILKTIKPKMSELEVKKLLEDFIREEGGELSFPSIVAFGKNSAIPHHMSNNAKLNDNDIILLDFGAKVDNYCSDMTRTVFMGKPNDGALKIYKAVKEAQEVAIDYLSTHTQDGFELKKAQELANSHIATFNFPDIPHSLGHGVGLQVHENPVVSPYSDEKLESGMIITVEPGVYLPEIGGVRIEDTALIGNKGVELLTHSSKNIVTL